MRKNLPIGQAKARFAECVRQVEGGDTIVLTRHGRPVARLTTVGAAASPRSDIGPAAEIREALQPYEPDSEASPRVPASVAESRRDALLLLLQESIWPRIPEEYLGKAPDKREREEILGFGSEGV